MSNTHNYDIIQNTSAEFHIKDKRNGICTPTIAYNVEVGTAFDKIDIKISHSKFFQLKSAYIDFLINFVYLYPNASKTFFMLVNEVSKHDKSGYVFSFIEKTKTAWADILDISKKTLLSHLKTLNDLKLVKLKYDEKGLSISSVAVNAKVFFNGKKRDFVKYEMNLNQRDLIKYYNKGRLKRNKKSLLDLRTVKGKKEVNFFSINYNLFTHFIDLINYNVKTFLLFLYSIRESGRNGYFEFSFEKAKNELNFNGRSKKEYEKAISVLKEIHLIKEQSSNSYRLNRLCVWAECIKSVSAEYARNVEELKGLIEHDNLVSVIYKTLNQMLVEDFPFASLFGKLVGAENLFAVKRETLLDYKGGFHIKKYRQKDKLEQLKSEVERDNFRKAQKRLIEHDKKVLNKKDKKDLDKPVKEPKKVIEKPESLQVKSNTELDRDLRDLVFSQNLCQTKESRDLRPEKPV